MKTWVVFQLLLKHVKRLANENLALFGPRISPSSHSISKQNYQNGNFSVVKRHGLPITPYAPAMLSHCHCFCSVIQLFDEMPQRYIHGREIHFELVDYIKLCLKKTQNCDCYCFPLCSLKDRCSSSPPHFNISTHYLFQGWRLYLFKGFV